MFQIMTEDEIKRADEITLRERVRALMTINRTFDRMIEAQNAMLDQQRQCLVVLTEIMNTQARMAGTLGMIQGHVRRIPGPKKKRKVKKRKVRR